MINKKKQLCYTELLTKLESLDMQICRVKEQLRELRSLFTASQQKTPPDSITSKDTECITQTLPVPPSKEET